MTRNRQGALEASKGLAATPGNIERLGQRFDPEAARWAFAQWELRERATKKFAYAERMLLIKEALEQATAEPVASYHASLFPAGVRVADLTAGIGGDLIALAHRGPSVGFELDPERVEACKFNLEVYGERADVRHEDSMVSTWDWSYAIADPSRRVSGRRTLDPTEFSPDPTVLSERFSRLKLGVIKLSPLLPDSFLESLGNSLRFVSFGGECREALVSTGMESRRERLAVHVESGAELHAGQDAVCVDQPEEFLFDCDPAAVRAHSAGVLCSLHGLRTLGDSRGYLTGNVQISSPWVRSYRILYFGKADLAKTRKELLALNAATPEVKQRLADQSPDHVRKVLKCEGKRKVSLVIWPIGRSLRHAIVEQVT